MSTGKKQLLVLPLAGPDPEIGRWLWALEDARQRTRTCLPGLDERAVDWQQQPGGHSIGTLLYHIAAIEISWFGIEVMEGQLPQSVWQHFPYEVRDEQGRLTIVKGLPLSEHWARLDMVRGLLLEAYQKMTAADFRRLRHLEEYDVTPEWVLHHLCQHEAEHRAELAALRQAAAASL